MKIAKIVVGIDFSEESELAAAHAIKVARTTGAQVILVHAGQVPDLGLPGNESAREWQRIVETRLSDSRTRLEEMRARLDSSAPEVSQISQMVISGYADAGLCDAGKQLDADIIAVGTHGRTGLRRFLLGSVAERVVRHFPGHVLVVRKGPGDDARFGRILVPTDFSAPAEVALRLAVALAAPDARIDLFNAWDTPPEIALEWTGPILDELASLSQDAGTLLLEKYKDSGPELAFECERAQPVAGIQERLGTGQYDLVVMGSHGRRGFKRFLLGSVAERIVRHAPCSVLVAHTRDREGQGS